MHGYSYHATPMDEPTLLKHLLNHVPSLLIHDNGALFPIVINSGVTVSVSYVKEDFVELLKPLPFQQMKALTETLDVAGRGTIQWIFNDDAGQVTIIQTEVYYVPDMTMQLLSPQAYFHNI